MYLFPPLSTDEDQKMNLASSEIHSPRYIFFVFVYNTYPTYFFCVKSRKVISVKIFLNNNQLHAQNRDWGVGGLEFMFYGFVSFFNCFHVEAEKCCVCTHTRFLKHQPY